VKSGLCVFSIVANCFNKVTAGWPDYFDTGKKYQDNKRNNYIGNIYFPIPLQIMLF